MAGVFVPYPQTPETSCKDQFYIGACDMSNTGGKSHKQLIVCINAKAVVHLDFHTSREDDLFDVQKI